MLSGKVNSLTTYTGHEVYKTHLNGNFLLPTTYLNRDCLFIINYVFILMTILILTIVAKTGITCETQGTKLFLFTGSSPSLITGG